MNCPNCYQNVANEEHAFGRWIKVRNKAGKIVGHVRWLFLRCSVCGRYKAKVNQFGKPLVVDGPLTGDAAAEVDRHIPVGHMHREPECVF